MRYAIFTDIHANLEALNAVLTKIDELAKEKPIDQLWFLGDLVGYGPNPNECITKVRERTDIIIAGNHDWAAVGKIDLEDFSAAARISAEWTAEQLTEEHRTFLINLPERLEIDECTLVHGSPYGPLWEYLTSEVLAERSFQYFSSRFCFVGHTHVPVIFQQPDPIANAPTLPLLESEQNGVAHSFSDDEDYSEDDTDETAEIVVIQPTLSTTKTPGHAESAYADPETGQAVNEAEANSMLEAHMKTSDPSLAAEASTPEQLNVAGGEDPATSQDNATLQQSSPQLPETAAIEEDNTQSESAEAHNGLQLQGATGDQDTPQEAEMQGTPKNEETPADTELEDEAPGHSSEAEQNNATTPEDVILNAEDRLNSEIEELLTLLGLSESMIQVTNEMLVPPEGHWEAPEGYRAIVNPGGVGQPRDGDPRAAFMIYDTEEGFEFYRIPYEISKTQEKIIKAGLPQYLAIRLAYGR